jgi:hypothetical protein
MAYYAEIVAWNATIFIPLNSYIVMITSFIIGSFCRSDIIVCWRTIIGYLWGNLLPPSVALILKMPANIPQFVSFEEYPSSAVLDALLDTDDLLVRLDERIRASPVGRACVQRLLYRNACAAMQSQNCMVYLEDLVLLDGHAFSGVMYPDLSAALFILKLWQTGLAGNAATLLDASMPGELERPLFGGIPVDPLLARHRPDMFYDAEWEEAERLRRWRHVFNASTRLPPVLAAATIWDAWHTLQPEQQGTWRAPLLASLLLRVRGKTRHLILPLDHGQRLCRKGWRAVDDANTRVRTFFEIVRAAIKGCANELDGLASAKERMSLRLRDAQKNSRLPDLVELLIEKPLVSVPLAAKALGISQHAVRKMLPRLGSTPREISDRLRYRCWTVP